MEGDDQNNGNNEESDPSNKRLKIDDQADPNQQGSVITIDEISIQELTQKIQQLGARIQQKQESLAETRQKIEEGYALTKNLSSMTQGFDQFVELLLDQAESETQNEENESKIEIEHSNEVLSNLAEEPETQLLLAAKTGDLDLVKQLIQDFQSQQGSNSIRLHYQSALFSAFQHGNNEIIEYLIGIDNCSQINLQELCNFYSQLRDKELIYKCRKCLKTVIDAMELEGSE